MLGSLKGRGGGEFARPALSSDVSLKSSEGTNPGFWPMSITLANFGTALSCFLKSKGTCDTLKGPHEQEKRLCKTANQLTKINKKIPGAKSINLNSRNMTPFNRLVSRGVWPQTGDQKSYSSVRAAMLCCALNSSVKCQETRGGKRLTPLPQGHLRHRHRGSVSHSSDMKSQGWQRQVKARVDISFNDSTSFIAVTSVRSSNCNTRG